MVVVSSFLDTIPICSSPFFMVTVLNFALDLVAFLAANNPCSVAGIIAFLSFGNCAKRQIFVPTFIFSSFFLPSGAIHSYLSYSTSTYS